MLRVYFVVAAFLSAHWLVTFMAKRIVSAVRYVQPIFVWFVKGNAKQNCI